MLGFKKVISLFLSLIIGFFTYPISFFTSFDGNDFQIINGDFSANAVFFNSEIIPIQTEGDCVFKDNGTVCFSESLKIVFDSNLQEWFNYYGISYYSDAYVKGTVTYCSGIKEKSEDFFLEPSAVNGEFYSFVDDFLKNTKADKLISIEFEPLDKKSVNFKINGIATFNRSVPKREIFIENENYKLGIDLLWGGALSYLEDKNSDVEAVKVNDTVKVDSRASKRYNSKVINSNVNLINRFDTGRLIQQSYYGTVSGSYDPGIYMDTVWAYNPVQGGNQYNDSSKIVDVRVDECSVYIKCRPLDWAKEKEFITPSYMEAKYEFVNNSVHAECRFTDFSGYNNNESRSQEIPAFYCIEPLNNFVYYSGSEPWTDKELSKVNDLIFWPDAGYPTYNSSENWAAFIGEFNDSFGIGLYVPGETEFLTGVYDRGVTQTADPSTESPTSYIAVIKDFLLRSFEPYEYEFYITTGNTTEIRNNFNEIR